MNNKVAVQVIVFGLFFAAVWVQRLSVRRWRFRLKDFMIAVTVACCFLGAFAYLLKK